jgi:hypothetical protein
MLTQRLLVINRMVIKRLQDGDKTVGDKQDGDKLLLLL